MISPDLNFELSIIPKNCRYLLAIDEVGRGPWAGPVTMAACLFDLHTPELNSLSHLPLRDSKLLTSLQRQKLSPQLSLFSHQIKSKDNNYIDKYGMAQALKVLIDELISSFPQVDFLLIDGIYKLKIATPYKAVIKGDQSCYSIAAASVLAKLSRDAHMGDMALLYPEYSFEKHKGYGTATHRHALNKYGPCPIHRLSFKPLRAP